MYFSKIEETFIDSVKNTCAQVLIFGEFLNPTHYNNGKQYRLRVSIIGVGLQPM